MKYIKFFFLLLLIVSCSTAKNFSKKWTGKTDQDVVKEFGMPDSVANNLVDGKSYFYFFNSNENLSQQKVVYNTSKNDAQQPTNHSQSYFFNFNSSNIVIDCSSRDTAYKSKGNYFIKKN